VPFGPGPSGISKPECTETYVRKSRFRLWEWYNPKFQLAGDGAKCELSNFNRQRILFVLALKVEKKRTN
jgi:hypothetical protein